MAEVLIAQAAFKGAASLVACVGILDPKAVQSELLGLQIEVNRIVRKISAKIDKKCLSKGDCPLYSS